MRVTRRFVISGRVQGVGFRMFAHETARREGLHGFVRNNADGTVEAVAEGESAALERFERAIRQGPSRARVEQVMVDDVTPTGLNAGFQIR